MTFIVATAPASRRPGHGGGHRSRDAQPGAWILALDLIHKSPPTWLDSRVIIGTLPSTAPDSTSSGSSRPETPGSLARITSTGALRSMLSGVSGERELHPIVFRMRSPGAEQLQGDGGRQRGRNLIPQRGEVTVNLSEHVSGNSLEFEWVKIVKPITLLRLTICDSGCPYILPDGSLNVVLEAKLVKPKENNPDCVFM